MCRWRFVVASGIYPPRVNTLNKRNLSSNMKLVAHYPETSYICSEISLSHFTRSYIKKKNRTTRKSTNTGTCEKKNYKNFMMCKVGRKSDFDFPL